MSRLMVQHRFGDEVISAEKLQDNFAKCETALNTLDGENFDNQALTNECLVAHTVSSMVTFAPSTGVDVSWAGVKQLGSVTYGDWEVYKMAVWCLSNPDSCTIQLAASDPRRRNVSDDKVNVGPRITPYAGLTNEQQPVLFSPVYGVTLKKGQALWFEQLLSDGTTGAVGDNTTGPVERLRISVYYRMPLRRS